MAIFGEYYASPAAMTPSTLSLSQFKFFQEVIKDLFSDSRVKTTFETLLLSDSAIYFPAWGNIEKSSDSRIFVPDNIFIKLSDSRIKVINNEITKSSDTRILDIFKITKSSDTAIFHPAWGNIELLSDQVIRVPDNIFTKTSDSWIQKINEISRVSDTTIFKSGLEVSKSSDSAIKRLDYEIIDVSSDVIIKRHAFDTKLIPSFSLIKTEVDYTLLADTAIFKSGFLKSILSDSNIIAEGTGFINIPSDSLLSVENLIEKVSDTFIVLGQDISLSSDSAIFREDFDILELLSDSAILVSSFNNIQILSDSAIHKEINISKLSDSRILRLAENYPYQTLKKISDVNIEKTFEKTVRSLSKIRQSFIIDNLSNTLIKSINDISLFSDSYIKNNPIITSYSKSTILNIYDVDKLSDTHIKTPTLINLISDVFIDREPILELYSNSNIIKSLKIISTSDSYMINEDVKVTIPSNVSVFRPDYNSIKKYSDVSILSLGKEKILLSNSRSLVKQTNEVLSDTKIKRYFKNITTTFKKSR